MQENLTRQKIPTNVNMIILYEPKKRTTFPLQLYTYPELEISTDKVAIEKSLNEMFSLPLNQSGKAELNSLYLYYASFKPHKSSLIKYYLVYVVKKQISSSLAFDLMKKYVGVFKKIKFVLSGNKAKDENKMKELLKDFNEINNEANTNDLFDIEIDTTSNNSLNDALYDDDKDSEESEEKDDSFMNENYELFRQNENQVKKILWWRRIKVGFIIMCFTLALVLYITLPFMLKSIKSSEEESEVNIK